jgi:hypothetical protein
VTGAAAELDLRKKETAIQTLATTAHAATAHTATSVRNLRITTSR